MQNIWNNDFMYTIKSKIKSDYNEDKFQDIDGVVIEFYIDDEYVIINRWYSFFAKIPIQEFYE